MPTYRRQSPTIYPWEDKAKGSHRRHFPPGLGRKLAIQELAEADAMKRQIARFTCPDCHTAFPLTYSRLVSDTRKWLSPPVHVCKDCGKKSHYVAI